MSISQRLKRVLAQSSSAAGQVWWRVFLTFLVLINLGLLVAWLYEDIGIFLGEWDGVYEENALQTVSTKNLAVAFYGPEILIAGKPTSIAAVFHNESGDVMRDVRIAVVDPNHSVRFQQVDEGSNLTNVLQVDELMPSVNAETLFELIPSKSTIGQSAVEFDVDISYLVGGKDRSRAVQTQLRSSDMESLGVGSTISNPLHIPNDATRVEHYVSDAFGYELSRYSDVHRDLSRWLHIGQGGVESLGGLTETATKLTGAMVGLAAAIGLAFKPVSVLWSWIRAPKVGQNRDSRDVD
jgi:hypothetical protein